MRRIVVWIEGPDGAGKTTLATKLAERLTSDGYKVTSVHFPLYVKVKKGDDGPAGTPVEIMLDVLEEFRMVADGLRGSDSEVIIFDRGPLSTAIYNATDLLAVKAGTDEWVRAILMMTSAHFTALNEFVPDILVWLNDVSTVYGVRYAHLFSNIGTVQAVLAEITGNKKWTETVVVSAPARATDGPLAVVMQHVTNFLKRCGDKSC